MSSSKPQDDASRALAAAVRYANRGVRSRREVAAHLRRRGWSSRAVAQAAARCAGGGFVDDRVGARLWAEQWARQGYAWAAIRVKLAAKGFSARAIEEAARGIAHPVDEAARARQLIATRRRSARDPRQRFRLARLLLSRGFYPELIEQVLGASIEEDGAVD